MSGIRLAALLPRARACLAAAAGAGAAGIRIASARWPEQTAGSSVVAGGLDQGRYGHLTVLFDAPQSAGVVRKSRDRQCLRRLELRLVLSDWKAVGGGRQARAHPGRTSSTHGGAAADLKEITTDAPIRPLLCRCGRRQGQGEAGGCRGAYQWMLRRTFLGRLLDSDKVYSRRNGGFKLVELAPNVQHVSAAKTVVR